ncbi:MAG: hypothetical protein DRJ09_05840 [Bacteroidetes bacterium]|nr:MAG: hypothetical protein DRJ09_05840 [Bacteroidota bacterium]
MLIKIDTVFKALISVVLLTTTLTSCKKNDGGELPPADSTGRIEKLEEVDLTVTEPSGLSFGPNGNTLLTVSDNTNKVYEMDLQGEVIRELNYTGFDLEGVTYNTDKQIVAVTEERKREIVFLDYTNGDEIERHSIETGGNTENKGLEGLSYNPNNSAWYMVNEDVPGEMIIWNKTFENISVTPLNFASDYSGIFVDTKNSLLYIVSDESQALYKCDYNANVLKEYPLPSTKFEGIAVDSEKQRAYLVNDKSGKLFIFKLLN